MALPLTISGILAVGGLAGPFMGSNNRYYFVGRDSTTFNRLRVWKATDPTSSFSNLAVTVDVANTSSASNAGALDAVQDGDVLHVASCLPDATTSTSTRIHYHKFDMSSDTWTLSNEAVDGPTTTSATTGGDYRSISIVRRSASVVIAYQTAFVVVMSANYSRVGYRERTDAAGTWGAAVAVDAIGAVATSANHISAVKDPQTNRIHFFWLEATALRIRTLSAANALNTAATSTTAGFTSVVPINPFRGVGYVSGGTSKIVLAKATPWAHGVYFNSADNPTINVPTGTTAGTLSSLWRVFADNDNVYALFVDSTSADMFVAQSTDHGATWGTATQIQTATFGSTTAWCSTNTAVYIRGSNYVIPYVANDAGTVKYNEYAVRAAGPVALNVSGAQTTLAVSQSATAAVDLVVTGAQTTLEAISTGTVQTLLPLTVDGAQTTQATTQSATAAVGLVVTTGLQTTLAATTAATATTGITVTGAQTTLAATSAATATTPLTVTGAQTTLATTQSGTVEVNTPLTVTGSQTTTATTQVGTIAVRLVATAAQTLAPVLQTALVGVVPTVIGAQTTLAASTSATAATIYTVTGSQTTLAATQTGTIQTILPLAVTGAQTTNEAITAIAATVRATVTTGSQTTNAVTQTSDTKAILAASATQTMLAATHAATATTGVAITGAQTLSAPATAATITTTNQVTGAQTTSATTQTSAITLGPAFINVSGAQTTEAATQTLSVSLGAAFLTVTGTQTTLAATTSATVTTAFAVTGAQTTSAASTTGTLSAELAVAGAQTTNAATTSATAATTAGVNGAQTLTPATTAGTIGLGVIVNGAQILPPAITTGTLTAPPALTVTGAQQTLAATQTLSVSLGDPFLTVNGAQLLPQPGLLAIASVRLVADAAQTTEAVRTDGSLHVDVGAPLNVSGFQAMEAALSTGSIGAVIPVTPEEGLPVAPGGPSRAAQRRLKQAIENRSRFEAERAKRLAGLTNDRPLFVTPPETLEMINEVLVEDIDHSVLFEDEAEGEELLLLLWAA